MEEGGSVVGDEGGDRVQSKEDECNIADDSYSPDEVADSNAGVNGHVSDGSNAGGEGINSDNTSKANKQGDHSSNDNSNDSKASDEEGKSLMAIHGYDDDNDDNCDSSDYYSDKGDKGDNRNNGHDINDGDFEGNNSNEHNKDD